MTTFNTISLDQLASVSGGADSGVQYQPAGGYDCTGPERGFFQSILPSKLGGQPAPTCVQHDKRVVLTKGAGEQQGAQVGFSAAAKRDIGNGMANVWGRYDDSAP
jgi:hypothetical protein